MSDEPIGLIRQEGNPHHLRLLGFEVPVDQLSEDDLRQHLAVVLEALAVHNEKEGIRHGLWKKYPAKVQTFQIKIKAERILQTLERAEGRELTEAEQDNILEEYRDINNYSVFGHRIVEGEADPTTTKDDGPDSL